MSGVTVRRLGGDRTVGGPAPVGPAPGGPDAAAEADPTGDRRSPAADPLAPYARLAVVGLICRLEPGQDGGGGADETGDCRRSSWLLLHRTEPFEAWDPPGGRMESGEDLVRAVSREVREETGLAVEVAGACYAFLTFYQGERLLAVSMACRTGAAADPDTIRLEPGGAAEWRWVAAQEWEELAAAGMSSWDPADVKKATRAVAALWEAERG